MSELKHPNDTPDDDIKNDEGIENGDNGADAPSEHDELMDELFADLDDEGDDTPETGSASAEKIAQLAAQNAALVTQLEKADKTNESLEKKIKEYRGIQARAEDLTKEKVGRAAEKFVKDMLPVIDTLELALKSIQKSTGDDDCDKKFDSMAKGVEVTLAQINEVFAKHGVEAIAPEIGSDFDADFHAATAVVPKPDAEPETIVGVMQKGYTIKGRLLRPASVAVTPG